jgi:peptidylprolyl isomerase
MKTQSLLSALLAATALPLAAQTTPPVHHTATTGTSATATHSAGAGCAKTPTLSPKIPAVPATAPCAKSLFRFTTSPNIRLDYVSPLVTPEMKEALNLTPVTFALDYIDTKIGTGDLAQPGMDYTLQYTGYLVDGTQFDTSVGKPAPFTFPIGAHRVIPGWDLGFQGMRVGGKRRLFIPYQLAYGDKGQGLIPPKAELVFDIELLSQKMTEPPKPPTPPAGAAPRPAPKPETPLPSGGTVPTPSTAPAKPATTAPTPPPASPAPSTTTPPATKPPMSER